MRKLTYGRPCAISGELAGKIIIHVIVQRTCKSAAIFRVRMNDSHSEFGFGESQLSAQNITRAEFDDPAFLLQIARTRFHRVNETDVNAPRRQPVAEPEEAAPFAVWIPLEQERLKFLPVGCRDPKQAELFCC